jgi:hypothetical protein
MSGHTPAQSLAKWTHRRDYLTKQIAAVQARLDRDTKLLAGYERALPEAHSYVDKWTRRTGGKP